MCKSSVKWQNYLIANLGMHITKANRWLFFIPAEAVFPEFLFRGMVCVWSQHFTSLNLWYCWGNDLLEVWHFQSQKKSVLLLVFQVLSAFKNVVSILYVCVILYGTHVHSGNLLILRFSFLVFSEHIFKECLASWIGISLPVGWQQLSLSVHVVQH